MCFYIEYFIMYIAKFSIMKDDVVKKGFVYMLDRCNIFGFRTCSSKIDNKVT